MMVKYFKATHPEASVYGKSGSPFEEVPSDERGRGEHQEESRQTVAPDKVGKMAPHGGQGADETSEPHISRYQRAEAMGVGWEVILSYVDSPGTQTPWLWNLWRNGQFVCGNWTTTRELALHAAKKAKEEAVIKREGLDLPKVVSL